MTIKKQHFWIDREYERIPVDIPCLVGLAGDTGLPAGIINLSAGGLKFGCNRDVFNQLLPEDQRVPGLVSDIEIDIEFRLPDAEGGTSETIRNRATIIHTERLAQDRYTLGVRFSGLDEADAGVIRSGIEVILARRDLP